MPSSSVKCMFPDPSSSESDSDSDTEIDRPARSGKHRLQVQPVGLYQFSSHFGSVSNSQKDQGEIATPSKSIDNTNESRENKAVDDGEAGLFIIDSTGGGGSVSVKDGKEKCPEPSPLNPGVDLSKCLYIDLDFLRRRSSEEEVQKEDVDDSRSTELVNELMKKATFKPSLEKNPMLRISSKGEQKRRRKAELEKTKGTDWFNMPATELTEERKRDLQVMQLRDVLDTKNRYRSDDRTVLPKYFQIGTVIEHPADFYHSRIPRKERKQTIVDELLADAEFQKKSKRKYAQIVQKKTKYGKSDSKDADKSKKRKLKGF